MTPELQKYYENRLSMCASDAWKDLMEDVQKMLDSTDKVSIVKDANDLYFRKGEVSIMQWLISLQAISEQSYKELQDAKADA